MKKILLILALSLFTIALFSQENKADTTIKIKPHFKYEIITSVSTAFWNYPAKNAVYPVFNLEFGANYKRWKFKIEPKVAYEYDKDPEFKYALTAKIGYVIWKSK
jgi:hypothetical protein